MANWGRPDFNDVVTEEEKAALRSRVLEVTKGNGLTHWPLNDKVQRGYPPNDVRAFCVQNQSWQRVRLSMKGKDTHEKLAILLAWWEQQRENANERLRYQTEVQVGNYLGALRRGGQLDDNNCIRRWR